MPLIMKEDKRGVPFGSLSHKEPFEWRGEIFMKIFTVLDHTEILNLREGTCSNPLAYDEMVRPVTIEMTVTHADIVQPNVIEHGMTCAERELILLRRKIPAIKAIRERTGLGLKAAKEIADAYEKYAEANKIGPAGGNDALRIADAAEKR